jgi:O-antigen ligase
MKSLRKRHLWSPKHLEFISAGAYFLLGILYSSQYKIKYLDWGIGGIVGGIMVLFFLYRGRTDKKEYIVVGFPLLWIGYALVCTPFVYSTTHHINSLLQTLILTSIAIFVIISLFSHEKLASRMIIFTVVIWVIVNFCFWCAWISGSYSYEKIDFSGLFNNRNEFSVHTIILMSMFLFLVKKHKHVKYFVCILSFILIVASRSTKGFLFFFFVLFYPVFLRTTVKRKVFVLLVSLVMVYGIIAVLPSIRERILRFVMVFASPAELRLSESAFLRTWLIINGFNLIVKNPIFGLGIDNSRYLLIPPHMQLDGSDAGLYSHNNFIEMGLNAGIFGLLLFYFPIFHILFKVNKSHRFLIPIKVFSLLYIFLGLAMVQYNSFISIILYCLIIFLYYYHETAYEKDIIHRQHA